MPAAAAAMGMKVISARLLGRFGYRQVLIVNTVLLGVTIGMYAFVGSGTPVLAVLAISLFQGFFSSLQFSSINSIAYADVPAKDASMASTMASSMQQLSVSFGLACGSMITAWYLGDMPQSNRVMLTQALHHAFLTLAALTILSSASYWTLRRRDGESMSHGGKAKQPVTAVAEAEQSDAQ